MVSLRSLWFVVPILLAGGVGIFFVTTTTNAQPTRTEEMMDQQGKVVRMTTAPRGEIDGAVLEDGTWLHWPPHLQDQFTDTIKVGDQVKASGRFHTTPHGDRHFEVKSVTNVSSKTTIENRDFGFGPPRGRHGRGRPPGPPHDRHEGPVVVVKGTVEKLTTAPRGETDGATLDNGTWVHWPPHLQDQFVAIVHPGDKLEATGRNETGHRGESRFEVQSVTNVGTKDRVENVDFRGEPGPRPPRGPHGDVEPRLRELQEQIDRLQQEVKQLREAK